MCCKNTIRKLLVHFMSHTLMDDIRYTGPLPQLGCSCLLRSQIFVDLVTTIALTRGLKCNPIQFAASLDEFTRFLYTLIQ